MDGNSILHLEALPNMMPWLTIYDHTNYLPQKAIQSSVRWSGNWMNQQDMEDA